jgi:hypothetical protein
MTAFTSCSRSTGPKSKVDSFILNRGFHLLPLRLHRHLQHGLNLGDGRGLNLRHLVRAELDPRLL